MTRTARRAALSAGSRSFAVPAFREYTPKTATAMNSRAATKKKTAKPLFFLSSSIDLINNLSAGRAWFQIPLRANRMFRLHISWRDRWFAEFVLEPKVHSLAFVE